MNILVIIESNLYLRNFYLSGALNELLKRHRVRISLSNKVDQFEESIPKKYLTDRYYRNEDNKNTVAVFNIISMKALSHLSSTFKTKTDFFRFSIKDRLIYSLASNKLMYPLAKQYLINKLKPNNSLKKVIKKIKPELVIFPLSGYEATNNELVLLAKEYAFKNLFLVNGWDNLSSKGILALLPDYLGVWGAQALTDAILIHQMLFKGIFQLGCSRYDNYVQKLNANKKHFSFKYVLFSGAGNGNDEITPLLLLDKILEKHKMLKINIVYRPHPMRSGRDKSDYFDQKQFKHVIIDPQVKESYYQDFKQKTSTNGAQNFPELEYYPGLLNHALFHITPMSSMLIESALFDVPSIALAHNDGTKGFSPELQAQWKHFEGADMIPGWFMAKSLPELEKLFITMIKRFKNASPKKREFKNILSSSIKKYLYYDERLYSERLLEVISQIEKMPKNSD